MIGIDGHLGLRAGILPYRFLAEDSSWSKRVLAELRPGKEITDFSAYSADTYISPVDASHDGVRLDIVGVTTLQDAELIRAESLALCDSTPGTYYYDVTGNTAVGKWDDGSTQWDDGSTQWDQFPALYVHLTDGTDPSAQGVEAEFLLPFATNAGVHPSLGPNRIVNGGFENWTGAALDSWTAGGSGGTETEGSTDPLTGSTTLDYVLAGGTIGVTILNYQDFATVPGATYRFSGAYRNSVPAVRARILVYDTVGAVYVQPDGKTTAASASSSMTLGDTENQWKRFTFDFIAPSTATNTRVQLLAADNTPGAAGTVSFDDVTFYCVHRWNYYAGRISSASVPTVGTSSNDVFFGGKQTGIGSVTLLNQDSYFETLAGLDWINRKCYIKVGGAYSPDADATAGASTAAVPISYDDFRTSMVGLIQSWKVDDAEATLDLEDIRSTYLQTLPPRTYNENDYADLADADNGKYVPLWFGAKNYIKPVRIGIGASVGPALASGYGIYKLADTVDAPNGIKAIDDVHFYEDEESAVAVDDSTVISNVIHANEYANFRPDLNPDPTFSASTNTTNGGRLNTTKTAGANNVWNAGAVLSVQITSAENAYCEGTVGAGAGTRGALGISTNLTDYNPNTTGYAIEWTAVGSGAYHIWIGGVDTSTTAVIPQKCDRVRIHMPGDGTVTFYVNHVLIYTSNVAPSGTYNIRAMFYVSNTLIGYIMAYRKTNLRYTTDLDEATITVTYDPGPYRVVSGANGITFSHTGTNELTATLPPGLYAGGALAGLAGGAMAAAAAADTTHTPTSHSCLYSQSTHLMTFTLGTSAVLEVSSGTERLLYALLGFTGANRTTATSHVSDTALFTDPDTQHHLRVLGKGYKDDASGTYTGTANALIETGADILRCITQIWLKRPASSIDTATFQAARTRAPETLGVYLNTATTTKEIIETLEFSNIANISIGGDGTVFYDVYVGDIPAGIMNLDDRDFSSFGIEYTARDVYKTIHVKYDRQPSDGTYPTRSRTNSDAQARFGRPDPKEFTTYLFNPDNAQACADRLGELSRVPARQLSATVFGKLLDHRIGQKVSVTRERAADPGGKLSDAVFRLISVRQNHAAGQTEITAVDDIVTVAGVACVTTCQSFCQSTCQDSCEAACQSTCQTACQVGCQVACQDCAQSTCQTICQTSCQEACQLSCQAACEAACQGGCQSTCQTGCQVSCQTGCQVSCQTGCQVSCQTTCEVACQTTCETACQAACELNCQTACETSCQTACQFECQSAKQNP
jgi:hypothetical protein